MNARTKATRHGTAGPTGAGWRLGALALLASLGTGCALTNKADPLAIRWYTLENTKPELTSATRREGGDAPIAELQLQLGRITSGADLRERIAFRDSAFEQGFYEEKRWTERPEVYVRRELERTLFEERGFQRALASQAAILEVELVAFEEVVGPGVHAARVQLKFLVHDGRDALVERTVTASRPVDASGGASSFAAVVQAMGQALDAAADEIAADTARVLRARATAVAEP